MTIGERIKKIRESQGINLTQLARRCRISKAYLSQLESGHSSRPSAEVVMKICRALDCTMETMLWKGNSEPTLGVVGGGPRSLRALARQEDLSSDDVRMLASISYKGRQPNSIEGWHAILETIRLATGED